MSVVGERTAVATVPSRIKDRALRIPEGVALREKRFGIWQEVTWRGYWEQVELAAHGLAALGVEPGDRVAIHSENRPEWLYADVAAVALRAMSVGLYPTNPPAEVGYLLADSGAKVLVAEDQEQVDKALEVADQLPGLERIVYVEPRGVRTYDDPALLSWSELLELGRAHRERHPRLLEELAAQVTADDVVTLIYTSGTTGPPKGAMLTVANIDFAIQTLVHGDGFFEAAGPDDVTLSYLPLCHVAERIATEWVNAAAGTQVHFAESIDTVQENLREVQPTLFFAVPRIWEKVRATVEIKMASASPLKRANYRLWMGQAARIGAELVANGGAHTRSTRLRYALGYPFLFRSLRKRLGLERCRFAGSGAAPIAPELLQWFYGLGVVIHEIYGMTENSAVATANRPGRTKIGTVGEPHPGVELRLDEQMDRRSSMPDAHAAGLPEPQRAGMRRRYSTGGPGEILTRHPGVFAGYWGKPDKTAEVLDDDGWLRTGDVGEWVDGTHLRIVDRLKDILITSGGKNVSPSEIENSLKFSPYIREAVVVGDRRPYLTALIGIELDTVGEWAQRRRIPYTTYRDLSEKPEVLALIQEVVDDTNRRLARSESIKRFRLIPKELDHEDGELTATQKVKRAAIAGAFGDLIEDMYRGGR
jgi:long-chain acyl-CoA synthetase